MSHLDKQIIINKFERKIIQVNENKFYSDEQKLAGTGILQGLLTEIKMGKYDSKLNEDVNLHDSHL